MSESRVPWLMRPIPAVSLLLIALIVATVFATVQYATVRTSSLGWVKSQGGFWEHLPGSLNPSWTRLRWALSIRRVVIDSPACPATEVLELGQLRALHELQELSLSQALLSDIQLRELRGLKHLRSLNLGDTPFADLGLKHSRFRSTGKVTGHISAADLDALQGLPLEELRLGGRDITGPMLPHLAGLPLRMLDLSDTQLGDDDLRDLPNLPLDELDLSGTNVTDAGLDVLSSRGIKRLRLGRTRITDRGIAKLAPLPLEVLDLQKTRITDAAVPELMKFRLELLNVDESFVTLSGVRALATHPSLRRLEVGTPQLAGQSLAEAAALSTSTLTIAEVPVAPPRFCPPSSLSPPPPLPALGRPPR